MRRRDFFRQIFINDTLRRSAKPRSRPNPQEWSNDAITGSCLGHSTVLLNFLGVTVLTDPVFSQRAGPGWGSFILGPKRYLRPVLKLRQVPRPDVILLSHAHFDHFDRGSLRHFSRDTIVVTASQTKDLLTRFKDVRELKWGESTSVSTVSGQIDITALEVKHWGARVLRDDYRGYNGYLLQRNGHAVCFAGDTAYTPAFARVRSLAPSLDLMLMPVAAYNPWIANHCNPEEAVAMANEAGAKYFVPIHHETFKLSAEPMDEPAKRVQAQFTAEPERLLALHVGETFHVPFAEPVAQRVGSAVGVVSDIRRDPDPGAPQRL